jgi:hypothetical protein
MAPPPPPPSTHTQTLVILLLLAMQGATGAVTPAQAEATWRAQYGVGLAVVLGMAAYRWLCLSESAIWISERRSLLAERAEPHLRASAATHRGSLPRSSGPRGAASAHSVPHHPLRQPRLPAAGPAPWTEEGVCCELLQDHKPAQRLSHKYRVIFEFYGPRLVATCLGWALNDFAFVSARTLCCCCATSCRTVPCWAGLGWAGRSATLRL